MQAGRMDRRVRIELAMVGARTPSGQPTRVWTLLREVWAEVVENRGQERFAAAQVVAKAELRFRIRYPAELEPALTPSENLRLVYQGRTYDILQVAELGRREGMEIWASTRAEAAA